MAAVHSAENHDFTSAGPSQPAASAHAPAPGEASVSSGSVDSSTEP